MYGNSDLSVLTFGGAGSGLAGGGLIYIAAASITVQGTVSADGGSEASCDNGVGGVTFAGGAGGGAGGSVYLLAQTIEASTALVTARGGTGATNCGGPGGIGGVGRIRLDAAAVSGTTTPEAFDGSP